MKEGPVYKEILSSEEIYVNRMRFFVEQMDEIKALYSNLSTEELKGKMPLAAVQQFSTIMQELTQAHEKFYIALKEEDPSKWAEHLKAMEGVYMQQVVAQSKLSVPDKVRDLFIQKGNLTPESYFILPIQRPPRYKLLFEDLQKRTPHPSILLALEQSKKLCDAMNQARTTKELKECIASFNYKNPKSFQDIVNFIQTSKELVSSTDFKNAFENIDFSRLSASQLTAIQTSLDSRMTTLENKIGTNEEGETKSELARIQELKRFLINKPIYDKIIKTFPIKKKSSSNTIHSREWVISEILQQLRNQRDGPQMKPLQEKDFAEIKKEAYLRAIKDVQGAAIKLGNEKPFDAMMQEINNSSSLLKKLGNTAQDLAKIWQPQTMETVKTKSPENLSEKTVKQSRAPLVTSFQRTLPTPKNDLKPAVNMVNSELNALKAYLSNPDNRNEHKIGIPTEIKVGAQFPHAGMMLLFEDKQKAFVHEESGGVNFSIPKNVSDPDFNETFKRICKLAVDSAKPGTVFDLSVAPLEKQEALETIFKETISQNKNFKEGDLIINRKSPQQKMG